MIVGKQNWRTSRFGQLLSVHVFGSRILLYIIMDKTKEECITQVENYYCQRLTELVDLKMYDEAHAIFEEFSLGDDE